MKSPVRRPPSSITSSPPSSPVSCAAASPPPYSPVYYYSGCGEDGEEDLDAIEVEAPTDYFKSSVDIHRERGAGLRALQLLDQDVAGAKHKSTARPEMRAETTRKFHKNRPHPDEDMMQQQQHDPETVAGMKCQLERDRQKWAKRMANMMAASTHFRCRGTSLV